MTELHAIADDRHGRRYRLAVEAANPDELGETEIEVWLTSLRAEGWTVVRAWVADADEGDP